MSGTTTTLIPSDNKKTAGGLSLSPRAKPEEILSKRTQNFARFKHDIESVRINKFPKMVLLFTEFLSQTFRESLRRQAIALSQQVNPPRFPGNPAEISILDILTTNGIYDYIMEQTYPLPQRTEDVELYKIKLKEHSDDMKTRKQHGEELFAYILTHLAEDSHAAVTTHPKFKAVQQAFNVAGLWIIIEEKHVGGDSNLANKKALREMLATKERFPCYELYVQEVTSLINQIKLGRGVVDEQEISDAIIDATKARLGLKDPEITKYVVPASEGRLPPYDVLLNDFMKYIRALESNPKADATITEQPDKDPNQAYAVASTPFKKAGGGESANGGSSKPEKYCKNHPWATNHTTAECRSNRSSEKKSDDPKNKTQNSSEKSQRGRGRRNYKNRNKGEGGAQVSFVDILESYEEEAYIAIVEERGDEDDDDSIPDLLTISSDADDDFRDDVDINEATDAQHDDMVDTLIEFFRERPSDGDALPSLEHLYPEPANDTTGAIHHAFVGRIVEPEARELILDLGANVGITHDTDLLVDHRRMAPGSTSVRGVHGQAKQATHCGQLGQINLGRAMVLPGANTELCSLPALLQAHPDAICIGTTDNFTVYAPENAPHLRDEIIALVQRQSKVLVSADRNPVSKLFTFQMNGPNIVHDDAASIALPATAITSDDPEFDPEAIFRRSQPALQSVPMVSSRNYTAEERRRAMAVRILHKERGHPSDAVMATALDAHAYGNCPYTSADLRAANDIYGPCDACRQGKATWPEDHHPYQGPTSDIAVGEVLHMDVSYFNEGATFLKGGKVTLVSVEHTTDKTHVRHLPSKDANKALYPALRDIVAWYRKYGHTVRELRCDPESCFAALGPLLARDGMRLVLLPPGIHDKITERKVRDIRACMRCIKADLAFELPARLHGELCSAVVDTLGTIPNSKTAPRSPDEILTGAKPVLPRVPIPWGTPVLATDPMVEPIAPSLLFSVTMVWLWGSFRPTRGVCTFRLTKFWSARR